MDRPQRMISTRAKRPRRPKPQSRPRSNGTFPFTTFALSNTCTSALPSPKPISSPSPFTLDLQVCDTGSEPWRRWAAWTSNRQLAERNGILEMILVNMNPRGAGSAIPVAAVAIPVAAVALSRAAWQREADQRTARARLDRRSEPRSARLPQRLPQRAHQGHGDAHR
jgi:hypothetical protein